MTSRLLFVQVAWRAVLDVVSRGTFFLLNVLYRYTIAECQRWAPSVLGAGVFGYAVSMAQMMLNVFTDMGMSLQLMKDVGAHRDADPTRWTTRIF